MVEECSGAEGCAGYMSGAVGGVQRCWALGARLRGRRMSVESAMGSMRSFPMTPMKPLSEIAYVPNAMVRSMGSDSDDLERPVRQREGGLCRPSPWWAVGGLIAIVVVLIAVVLVIELRTAPSEGGGALVAGVLSASVGGPAARPQEATAPAVAAATLVPATTTADPLGVIETAAITVAARSARISLSNVIRHALGTYAVEIDVVESARAYEAYATAPGSRVVLRLHGEMVGIAKATTPAAGLAAALDLCAALDPGRTSAGLDVANLTACVADADGERVHGVYVRTVCIDGLALPHARRPALRCSIVLEGACFAPGRSHLPPSVQHDAHNGPWVFSYTSTSTYVRRRR